MNSSLFHAPPRRPQQRCLFRGACRVEVVIALLFAAGVAAILFSAYDPPPVSRATPPPPVDRHLLDDVPAPPRAAPPPPASAPALPAMDAACLARYRARAGDAPLANVHPAREPCEGGRDGPCEFLWAVAPDHTIRNWLAHHEAHVRHFAARALSDGPPEGGLVVDIGANSGYYGLMGLAAGHRALFVEPQPYCAMLLELSLAANGWRDRATLLRAVAAADARGGLDVWCDTPCYGRVGAPGVGAPKGQAAARPAGRRPAVRVADHVNASGAEGAPVQFLKVDVEGAEAAALRGARPLFEAGRVRYASVEVTPLFYRQRKREAAMRAEIHEEFRRIHATGRYAIRRPRVAAPRDSARDYVDLAGAAELEDYLLRGAFDQHDVFIVLRPPPRDIGAK